VERAKKILKAMNYSGLSEVEFMLDSRDGKYKLIEINARSCWHSIAIGAGVDLPYLSYLDILGGKVKQEGFAFGVKWIRLITDVTTAALEILKGNLSISEYLNSFKGKKQYAVKSLDDPLPFIMELILLPYLWNWIAVITSNFVRKLRGIFAFRKYRPPLRDQEARKLQVRVIDPTTDSQWDRFVTDDQRSTIFHTSAWARVIKETYNYIPQYHIIKNKDGSVGAAIPFYLIRSKITGRRLVCLPFSDYGWPLGGDEEDIKMLLSATKNELNTGKGAATYLEIRGWQDHIPEAQSGLVGYDYFTKYLLELESDPEALKRKFHLSIRRCIHQAERRDVTVRLTSREEDMERFFRLHLATRKKLGVFPQPHAFFKSIFRHVISQNQGFLGIAEYKGKTVAGVVFLTYGDTIYYKFNASDVRYLQKRPNHLIIWEALKYACTHDYKYFDFGRCTPEEEGLRIFKARWGAKEIALPYYYYPGKKGFLNSSESSIEYRIMRLLAHVTPRWVYAAAGSLLYKHLG
jgi:CelD/BcsL family acetyltransferase involved in cellulose biosynthesis